MHYDHTASTRGDHHVMNGIKQGAFLIVHLSCFLVIWCGWSWFAIGVCLFMYLIRMFAITGGYHRYFSHRSYKTSRTFQFILGFLGSTSGQKGPLWWSSHHRHHHQHSDTELDIHPPRIYGLWYAHVGWVLSSQFVKPRLELVKDFLHYPEIRWLDKFHTLAPVVLAALTYGAGSICSHFFPSLNTSGFQLLVWGFFISTVLLYHGTFSINSLSHMIGNQRFKTGDDSRNNFFLAIITLGEGWHNNHHRYPGSEKQGFYWWEIDVTHYLLRALSWCGIVWDLRVPPERVYQEARMSK